MSDKPGSTGLELDFVFDLPETKPVAPTVASPVKIGFSGSIAVKGKAAPPNATSNVSLSFGVQANGKPSAKADVQHTLKTKYGDVKLGVGEANGQAVIQAGVEKAIKTEFGQVKFDVKVKPGRKSSIGVEIVNTHSPHVIELRANADFTKPVTGGIKYPIHLDRAQLRAGTSGIGAGWTFSGDLTPELDINITFNELWPGWPNLLRSAFQQSRAILQSGSSAIRGVYFAGEQCSVVSTAGASVLGAGVGVLLVAWVGLGMYQLGKASRDGRTMAVRYAFSNGYARMLADLTSNSIEVTRREAAPLLAIGDWKADLAKWGTQYVNGTGSVSVVAAGLGDRIEKLGKTAILNDIDAYIRTYGPPAWDSVRKRHQQAYGAQDESRRQRYLSILYNQVQRSADNLGIALA